jgi:metal-responsive CopG/Arc/MetJ family transcriptional regulator
MTKDSIVFVRLTKAQTRSLDRFVRKKNKQSTSVGKLSRSDLIREAITEWLRSQDDADPTLLTTIFAEEEIDRVCDQ